MRGSFQLFFFFNQVGCFRMKDIGFLMQIYSRLFNGYQNVNTFLYYIIILSVFLLLFFSYFMNGVTL